MEPVLQTSSDEKQLNVLKMLFWYFLCSPVIYIIMSELLIKYGFPKGQFGFMPEMSGVVYSIVKNAMIAVSFIEVVLIISVKISLNNGQLTWPTKFIIGAALKSEDGEIAVAQASFMMISALCMMISVYGFGVFLIKGIRLDAYPLEAAGLLLMFMFFPGRKFIAQVTALRKV